jgi:hypothetical protein
MWDSASFVPRVMGHFAMKSPCAKLLVSLTRVKVQFLYFRTSGGTGSAFAVCERVSMFSRFCEAQRGKPVLATVSNGIGDERQIIVCWAGAQKIDGPEVSALTPNYPASFVMPLNLFTGD